MSIVFLLRKDFEKANGTVFENCDCVMDDTAKWNLFDIFFIALPVQESGEETS